MSKLPVATDDPIPGGATQGRLGRVHDRVLDVMAMVDGGTPADRSLQVIFRRARDLGRRERAQVSDEVYAIARHRRRLDDRLKRGMKACGKRGDNYDTRTMHRLLVLCLLQDRGASEAELEARDGYAHRRIKGLFDKISKLKPSKKKGVQAIGLEWSVPDWLVQELVDAGGDQHAIEIAKALAERAPLTVRIDHRRINRDEAAARLAEELGVTAVPTKLSPFGLVLGQASHVEGTELYEEGLVEVQDEGSQLAAMAVGAAPGHNVVDACAGAGGKTLALASAMQGHGRIAAIDVDQHKLDELRRRVRRADLTNVETVTGDLMELPDRYLGWADRVLVDAPCSGSGTYRRRPDERWRITTEQLATFGARQAALLTRAADAAKAGGLVTYVTCSVLPSENEAVVDRVLREQPKLAAEPLTTTLGPELAERLGATSATGRSNAVRIGPGPTATDPDGFFIALFRRVG